MADKKPSETRIDTSLAPTERLGMTLFGRANSSDLPPDVQAVMAKFKTREMPGVAPSWLPEKPGETIAGVCVQYREGIGKYASSLIVLEGAYGFKSVWLGADLRNKITASSIGRPMMIVFEGRFQVGKNAQPMKTYRVIEVLEEVGS